MRKSIVKIFRSFLIAVLALSLIGCYGDIEEEETITTTKNEMYDAEDVYCLKLCENYEQYKGEKVKIAAKIDLVVSKDAYSSIQTIGQSICFDFPDQINQELEGKYAVIYGEVGNKVGDSITIRDCQMFAEGDIASGIYDSLKMSYDNEKDYSKFIEEYTTENEVKELSEKEYKNKCKEMWYDEVFFSDDIFEGEYVKLHLFLSQKYYFSKEDMYKDSVSSMFKEYDLFTDFYKCCVLRKDTNSYVGEQINVLFSQKYNLDPSNYKTGDKLVMYGQIISCSTNTWSGFNSVQFIPKYIEKEK